MASRMRAHGVRSVMSFLAVVGASAVIVSPAHALIPPCIWEEVPYWHPAVYAGLNGGDAVLLPTAGRTATDPVAALMAAVNLKYTHVALAYDSTGINFAESTLSFSPPPQDSHDAGAANYCSRVIFIEALQHLGPGTTGGATRDASDVLSSATIYPAMGRPACTSPSQPYEINSFLHDDIIGGSCEKYLADFCGVPVTTADKFVLPGSGPFSLNVGLQEIYNFTYPQVLGITSGLPWYDFAVCGGVDDTILAERATMQVVNEVRYKWYDMIWNGGGSCQGGYVAGMTPAQTYASGANDTGCLNVDTTYNRYVETASSATFIKDGDNGTVSCNTFCAGSQWGTVGTCVSASIPNYPCGDSPGLLSPSGVGPGVEGQLTCQCENGSGSFQKNGNNGTVSCNTFCAGSQWGTVGTCTSASIPVASCAYNPGFVVPSELACICQYPSGATAMQNLGAGETNNQWSGVGFGAVAENDPVNTDSWCMDVNQSNQTVGTTCPGWEAYEPGEANYGQPIHMNTPDNVATAAHRLGIAPKTTSVTPGYYTYSKECIVP